MNASEFAVALGDDGGDGEEAPTCVYIKTLFLTARFWLVTVFGTLMAAASASENLGLCAVLCRKKQHRDSHCLYLLLLAFFDFFIAFAYVPLMSVSVLADYLESPLLLNAWYIYMRPMITFSHIAMTTSTFLILAASFERFCVTCCSANKTRLVQRFRRYIAGLAMFLGFITKFTLFFELQLSYNADCESTMAENELQPSPLAEDYYYSLLWKIGIRNLVTIWVPFFCLLFMNMKIIHKLRYRDVEPLVQEKPSEVQRKSRVRAATRTLVCVVFTYLLANVLSVILAFWEYIDLASLNDDYLPFYLFSVDAVSIMTCVAGMLRPLVYIVCMPIIRKDVFALLKSFTVRRKAHSVDETLGSDGPERTNFANMLVRVTELLMQFPPIVAKQSVDSSNNSGETADIQSREIFL